MWLQGTFEIPVLCTVIFRIFLKVNPDQRWKYRCYSCGKCVPKVWLNLKIIFSYLDDKFIILWRVEVEWKILIWLPYISLVWRDNKLRDFFDLILKEQTFPGKTANEIAGRFAKVGLRLSPATGYFWQYWFNPSIFYFFEEIQSILSPDKMTISAQFEVTAEKFDVFAWN